MKRICLLVALAFAPAAAMAAFKCVDEQGRTHLGDQPPDACANVVMYEVSRSGTVIRKIDPPLSPEQVKANLDNAEKRKEADKVAAEQKRKDQALLNTYSSEREVDMTRDRNIEPIKARIKVTQERIAAVDKRVKEIEEELEFYKAGKSKAGKAREAPSNLVQDLERVKSERAILTKSLGGFDKEIETLRNKYDTDKKRWLTLKTGTDEKAKPR